MRVERTVEAEACATVIQATRALRTAACLAGMESDRVTYLREKKVLEELLVGAYATRGLPLPDAVTKQLEARSPVALRPEQRPQFLDWTYRLVIVRDDPSMVALNESLNGPLLSLGACMLLQGLRSRGEDGGVWSLPRYREELRDQGSLQYGT